MLQTHTTRTDARALKSVAAILRQVVLVFVAVAVAFCSTRTATASCGDYLFRNGKPVRGHSIPSDSMFGMHAPDVETDSHPIQIPVRRCSGPNCSSSPLPLAPVPVAPSSLTRGFDQAAVLESLVNGSQTRGTAEIPESERGARFEPSSIFRPPAA